MRDQQRRDEKTLVISSALFLGAFCFVAAIKAGTYLARHGRGQ